MIGGNIWAELQRKETKRNEIGEQISEWTTEKRLFGYLDLVSGDSKYEVYSAKMEESTHVFITDFTPLRPQIGPYGARMVIEGKSYDVTLIDNPMGLNRQLEFYLKKVG